MAGIVEAIREGEGEEEGEGEGEEEGEREDDIRLDPFVQPPILKALFEQLSLEELAKCRLVSKLWLEESLSTWRSKAVLKFDKEGIVSKREDGSGLITSLGEFLDLWDAGDWGSCPFKKFSIHWWKFIAGNVEQERFMELVGGHVTSLTLDDCSFVGRENFQRIVYQAFPKLQFLEMTHCEVDNAVWYPPIPPPKDILMYKEPAFGVHGLKSLDISWCFPDSMMDMLSHFHKLESLRLHTGFVNRGDYPNLLETIILIRAQDQTKLPLNNIDVVFNLGQSTTSNVEILKLQDRLKLTARRFEIFFDHDGNIDCNEDVIWEILRHHSSALKCLKFSGKGPHGLTNSFSFGIYLENLDELIIQSHRFFDSLNYLRNTPNLRVLKIYASLSKAEGDILFSNSAQLENGNWTLPALTDLTICLPLSVCNLRKLMRWMPNVERLQGVKLDDIKFSLVCKNWKDIQHLEDMGNMLTDEGVIGKGNVHEAGGDEATQSSPNITDLKNLTSFVTWSCRLTSASVHEGFLKLANLKRISLGRSTELDDEAKAALAIKKIRLDLPVEKRSACRLD